MTLRTENRNAVVKDDRPLLQLMRPSFGDRAFEVLGTGLRGAGLLPNRIDAEALMTKAVCQTGLTNFRDSTIPRRINELVDALEDGRPLTAFGFLELRGLLLEALKTRLYFERDCVNHPEIERTEVIRPLIIVGLPRTGTTLLTNLLATDPEARMIQQWEPSPPFPEERGVWGGDQDPRVAAFQKRVARQKKRYAEVDQQHAFDSPAECATLFMPSFVAPDILSYYAIDSYERYMFGRPEEEWETAYRFYHRRLQHLWWQQPKGHWILKSNDHMARLKTVLEVFPDARLIQTHREPRNVVGSFSHLVNSHQVFVIPDLEPQRTARSVLTFLRFWTQENLKARRELGADACYDVFFNELVADPMAVIRKIYEHFSMELTPAAEDRMNRFLEARHYANRPRYRYSLDQFDLTDGEVDEAFADYRDHFDLTADPKSAPAKPRTNGSPD